MSIKKELLDQSLHFTLGLVLVLLISTFLHIAIAAIIVALGAWVREGLQRIKNGDSFLKCGPGCRLDLIFWATGILAGVLIKIFVL